MDEHSLIALIQQNDLLYNRTNKDYKNIQKKKEVWEAIGLEVGASGDACRKRWSSLRDRYCRDVRRLACKSESGTIAEPKWLHYGSLSFLSGHMREHIMDDDSLIVLVQQNDLLYNETNKDYKNSKKKQKVWEAIGLEIGASGDECSKRWTSLRDRYCREVRRLTCSSGSGAIAETKWQHYGRLSFLNRHLRRGRQSSNFSSETEDLVVQPWECLEQSDIRIASPPLTSPVECKCMDSSLSATSSQPLKRRLSAALDAESAALLEISKTLKSYFEKEVAPQDMRAHSFGKFVESNLTGMPTRKQMKLMGDITQLLIAAQNEN